MPLCLSHTLCGGIVTITASTTETHPKMLFVSGLSLKLTFHCLRRQFPCPHVLIYVSHKCLSTVKPFMFACPLFREFCYLNKTAKLRGVNIDAIPTLIGITHMLELCDLNSPK